ncbi:hypothetical protein ISCGN_012624 [Ixodes scapularis]
MWTDGTGDEIIELSTENLQPAQDMSAAQRLLSSKSSVVLLASVAVLFSGVLPFIAFRAALINSRAALMPTIIKPAEEISDVIHHQLHARPTINESIRHPKDSSRLVPSKATRTARTAQLHWNTIVQPAVRVDKELPQLTQDSKPCSSAACKREALNLSRQLDDSVSPCDDFYQYVCGKWSRGITVPEGSAKVSVDTLTQDVVTKLVDGAFRRYLEDIEHVADLYNECRYHRSGDAEKQLFDRFVRQLGNVSWFLNIKTMVSGLRKSVWPMFATVEDSKLSSSIGIFYRLINEPALFSIRPTVDVDFPNETLIAIGLPRLVIGSFLGDNDKENYSYVSQAMKIILQDSNLTQGLEVNVLNVERGLARAIVNSPPEVPRIVQVEDLPSPGKLRWNLLFKAMLADEETDFSSLYVMVDSMRYLNALQDVLQELQDVEILSYLGFRTKLALAPLLPRNRSLDFLGALSVSRYPEWHPPLRQEHYCVRFFEKLEPVISLYSARDDIAAALRHLNTKRFVRIVKQQLLKHIAITFPNPFKAYIIGVLRRARWTSLIPQWVLRETSRRKYLGYYYTQNPRVPVHEQFARLIKRKNFNEYGRYLTGIFVDAPWIGGLLKTVAAVNSDRVDVPPAAFDFFRADADDSTLLPLQMSRIAPRIAASVYEFVYKESLNFLYHTGHKRSWLLLDEARTCLTNQFRDLQDEHVNMSLRSGAMGGDLLAHALSVVPAFKAFMSGLEEGDVYLRGMGAFSSEKMHFVYHALNYCELNDDVFLDRLLQSGAEAPAWHKVNAALRNSDLFSDVFNCSEGTFMNPIDKCSFTFQ